MAPLEDDTKVAGIRIKAIKPIRNPFLRIFISPVRAFFKALGTKSAVYHLHDPELLFAGVLFSILGKKVIFDSHENVGEQILTKEWIPSIAVRKIVSILYGFIEKFCTLFFTGIVAVNEDIRKRFAFKKRAVIIRNYPLLEEINQGHQKPIPNNNDKIIIYAGGLTKIRGIKELIIAMKDVDARLWLLGPWESNSYRKDCESQISWEKCDYFGTVPFGEQYNYLRSADVGVVIFYPEKNHIRSLPNKIFEYMACDLALVMSDFDYWKESFKDCALFVDPYKPDDIAEKINLLIHDKALATKISYAGKEKVNREYSWKEESKKLIQFYSKI